ncbi:MAG: RidA family protein [Eubacteriales bacterium]
MKPEELFNKIETKNAPSAIGPYSQAIEVGNFIFTSGQIPIDPHTGNLVSGGIEEQTTRVIKNLTAVLEEAGSNLDRVIKTTCYLQSIGDFAKFNAVYEKYFTGRPARSCLEVSAMPKGALVEIEVIAFNDKESLEND